MYLSKLEIFGFKSFAQKVSLTFDAGLTGIVGPNGCGKTNVVDAIRWALGEQRPTTLRSDKMEDVIFNGTKSRKPLNIAEVSITIENTKGILPLEYTEVTITRRVFRSGESEYYLNKTLCRLKDIRDLFMDTGMGSDAYSVIELKMVESILSDSSEERRRLFEESAGVTKYKYRRKEAYRRLETVRQDLTRVSDIVRSVEKAVNSLERQAQKAERYNELVKVLEEKEIGLLSREYANVVSRIAPLQEQLSVAVTAKNRIDVELRQEEALLEVLRSELDDLEDQLAAAQDDLAARQQAMHQLEQHQATAAERRRSLQANCEKYEQEKVDLEQQRLELEQKQTERVRALDQIRANIAAAEELDREKKARRDEFEVQLIAKKGELKFSQDRVITLLREITDLRTRENQVKARIENMRGRIDYIAEENEVFQQDVGKNSELIVRLTAEDRQLRLAFAEAEVRSHQMEDYKQKLQEEIDGLRREELEVRAEIERKQARIDFLKGLVESYDGYSEGARYLITSDEWSSKIQTTVGEAVLTDSRYRVAIETALGETAGYVVVDNVDEAYAAIDFLKQNNKGKATFICLNRIPHIPNHRSVVQQPGVIDWASNVIQVNDRHQPLFSFLLDETLVVRDVPCALNVISEHANIRCVTLDGEVVTGRGVVRGGSVRQDEGVHISKRSQLEELTAEVADLAPKLERVQRDTEEKVGQLERVNLRKLTEDARTIEHQKTSVEIRMAQLEFEKRRAQENIERNLAEAEKLQEEIESLSGELEKLSPSIQDMERRQGDAEQQVGASASEVEAMEALWNEYARVANDAHLAVLALRGEERSLQEAMDHAESTLQSIDSTVEQRTREVAESEQEIEALAVSIGDAETKLAAAQREYQNVLGQKQSVDSDFAAKRSQIHQIELKLKDERLRQEGSLKAAHDLEIKIQELSMKGENLKSRAKEGFGLELEVKEYSDAEQFDFVAAREEIQKLKEKIHNLGPVNFAAFDEYKSEKERLDFVTAQRDDLVEAEKTLVQTIDEINATAQRQFLDTFEMIRDNFITTFKGLFDEGDECDLRLEEGVDPLEARIEIVAKPRGKRPTSIDLLSGGEKTLTAIALLFAIYLVKPSPFCILDEVDAPLDDMSIDRFTRILQKFSDNTQFIVVTHNKRTMEATNALYGVTMEEEGVSKLVSVQFNESVEKN